MQRSDSRRPAVRRRRAARALVLAVLLAAPNPARAAEAGPVGVRVVGSEAWVAFAGGLHVHDLAWRRPPRVAWAASDPDAKAKAVAACEGCALRLFVVSLHNATSIHALGSDGGARELVPAHPDVQWKNVDVAPDGQRAWATDARRGRVVELRLDPDGPALLGRRTLVRVAKAWDVRRLPDGAGLLVTTGDDRLVWTDLEGTVLDDWDVAAACGDTRRAALRAAARDAATGALYALNHRSLLRLGPAASHGRPLASCTVVAGDPRAAGLADACGEAARFGHPHGLDLLADGSAAIVTDTDGDALRRVSLAPGAGFGCTSTIPLRDPTPPPSARSCAELGWPGRAGVDGDPAVCAGPTPGAAEACAERVTFEQARDACGALGARLCTHRELAADEARAPGCEARAVWSATRCVRTTQKSRRRIDAGPIAQAGAAAGLAATPPTCRPEGLAHLRCCADAALGSTP